MNDLVSVLCSTSQIISFCPTWMRRVAFTQDFFFFLFWFKNEILSSGDTKEVALGGKAINVLMPWLGQQVTRAAL